MRKIIVNDYTQYVEEKSSNGGCYGFWAVYTEKETGDFEVSYGTTADLEFCDCCGNFNCNNIRCENGEYQIVTADEMKDIINSFVETEDEWIDIMEI